MQKVNNQIEKEIKIIDVYPEEPFTQNEKIELAERISSLLEFYSEYNLVDDIKLS